MIASGQTSDSRSQGARHLGKSWLRTICSLTWSADHQMLGVQTRSAMQDAKRIKDLQRPYGGAAIPSWPPRWVPSYDGATVLPSGEDGMLTWVGRRARGAGLG